MNIRENEKIHSTLDHLKKDIADTDSRKRSLMERATENTIGPK